MHKLTFTFILLFVSSTIFSQKIDFQKIYDDFGVNGCFIIYDLKNDEMITYNEARLDSQFLPASTFKIINSLNALESGVIADENEVIKWDGKKRNYENWDKNQTLASALRFSVVWAYQELVERMGRDTIQYFIDSNKYGNQNIDGNLTTFWLNGELRITPYQQLDFLKKLYHSELKFSKKNIDIVKEIMILEKTDDYIYRAKTGWAMRVKRQIGWFVGYIEQNENVYFFVNNIDIKEKKDAKAREGIVKSVLREFGLL